MREILFEYGFESVNGIIKKHYFLHEIPFLREKCDVFNVLTLVYVRQFTGLTDKNGVKIFEGDWLHMCAYLCEVVFMDGGFHTIYKHPEDGETLPILDLDLSQMEVIGNIHTA